MNLRSPVLADGSFFRWIMDEYLAKALEREYTTEALKWRAQVRAMSPNMDGNKLVEEAKGA